MYKPLFLKKKHILIRFSICIFFFLRRNFLKAKQHWIFFSVWINNPDLGKKKLLWLTDREELCLVMKEHLFKLRYLYLLGIFVSQFFFFNFVKYNWNVWDYAKVFLIFFSYPFKLLHTSVELLWQANKDKTYSVNIKWISRNNIENKDLKIIEYCTYKETRIDQEFWTISHGNSWHSTSAAFHT